jgi:hypothetical protein
MFGGNRLCNPGVNVLNVPYLLGLSVGRGAAGTPEPLLPHWAAFLEATVADLTKNQENYYDKDEESSSISFQSSHILKTDRE